MISYEEQQKLNAMPRTMTISEIREELDRLNIKYTFYDCHVGSNNLSFTIFNAQVICPVGYSLDNGIYATDKNNWFVLNKERISKEKVNDFIDYQGSIEFYEMHSPLDLVNKEIKIHQAVDEYSQNIIHIFNYYLARLLLRENITDKANKKRIGEFDRLKNKENLLQVETPTPSTHQFNGLELIDKNLSSANALSTIDNSIIPQTHKSIAEQIKAESKDFDTLSTNERLDILEKNQQAILNMQNTKDLQQSKDSINTKQEKELKDSKNEESQTQRKRYR